MKKKDLPTVQMYDSTWYRLGLKSHHECCGCSLTHRIEYKLERGMIWERWTIDKRETTKARRAMKKPG